MTEVIEVNFYNRIELEEQSYLSWDKKLLGVTSRIQTTAELASLYKKNLSFQQEEVFLPKVLNKVLLCLFAIMLLYIAVSSIGFHWVLPLIVVPLYTLFIISIVRVIISKELNYSIHVNEKGIGIKNQFYGWQEIQETYIVWRPKSRGGTFFLLLGLQNGELLRYDLTNLIGLDATEKKLAFSIEHYRRNYA